MKSARNNGEREGSSANKSVAIIKELLQHSQINDITGSDLERARSLMAELKIMGFSDREISVLTNERWRPPTVRGYTKGAAMGRESAVKNYLAEIFLRMVQKDIAFDDINVTVQLKNDIDSKRGGGGFDCLLDLVQEANDSKIEPGNIIKVYQDFVDMQQASGGAKMSLAELNQALQYKRELDAKNIKLGDLELIAQAAGKYPLADIMNAVANCREIRDFEAQKNEAKTRLDGIKAEAEELGELIQYCNTLLDEFNYKPSTIRHLHNTIKKYGTPESVMKALEEYENLNDLKERVGKLGGQEIIRQARADELKEEIRKLNGQAAGLRDFISQLIDPNNGSLATALGDFAASYRTHIDDATRASRQYSEIISRASFLNGELRLVQVILGTAEDAEVARGIPPEFVGKLLQASRRICEVNQINPTIKPLEAGLVRDNEEVRSVYPEIYDSHVTLPQLLEIADSVLKEYIVRARLGRGQLMTGA